MFVRFRQTARRLQASLIETRRAADRVHHEHIASLGSVPLSPSAVDRIAFWTQLHERLARLANRIDAAAQGAILATIHARIPMPTQDEQQAERLEMAKEDSRQQSILAEMTTEQMEEHKQLLTSVQRKLPDLEASATASKANADAARERLAKLERGEDAPVSRPLSAAQILKAFGWTASDMRHAQRLAAIHKLGGDAAFKTLVDEVLRRKAATEKAVSRELLQLLLGARDGA